MAELCGLVDLQVELPDQAQVLAVLCGLMGALAEPFYHLLLTEVSGCVLWYGSAISWTLSFFRVTGWALQ